MDLLDISDLLDFMAGWSPPRNEFQAGRSRWKTWKEYMADWVAVREECLATEPFQHKGENETFAERVYKTFGVKGPPENATYDEIRAAFAAAEDENVAELLADVEIGDR